MLDYKNIKIIFISEWYTMHFSGVLIGSFYWSCSYSQKNHIRLVLLQDFMLFFPWFCPPFYLDSWGSIQCGPIPPSIPMSGGYANCFYLLSNPNTAQGEFAASFTCAVYPACKVQGYKVSSDASLHFDLIQWCKFLGNKVRTRGCRVDSY